MAKLNGRTKVDPLKNALREKSRHRREMITELATRTRSASARNDLTPRLELVYRAPASIKLPSRNVRKVDKLHVEEIAASMRVLGVSVPAIIDENDVVIDGVSRIQAALLLGIDSIPCVQARHLTGPEKKLLRIAINRLGEKGSWEFPELEIVLEELRVEEAPIEISGFSEIEIDQLGSNSEPDVVEPGPLTPDMTRPPISQVGDIFRLGEHRVACGDATATAVLQSLMEGESARLILTDEPYNVRIAGNVTGGAHREFVMASGEMSSQQFRAFNVSWMTASIAHLLDGGLFGTFIDWRGYPTIDSAALEIGLSAFNLIVWRKSNAGMGSTYRSQHELLPLYKKGTLPHVNNIELGKHGRWRSNVWLYPGASSIGSDARKGLQEHPTVKPVAMLEDAILDVTKRGDIVLDPFLGSGSTLIAADRTGRRCFGSELDPLYVDVIIRRYEALTGQQAVLEGSGETATELAIRRAVATPAPAIDA